MLDLCLRIAAHGKKWGDNETNWLIPVTTWDEEDKK